MNQLVMFEKPQFEESRMVIGFSGWMDGGEVSTGTVSHLIDKYDAQSFAEIRPDDFYVYNFPGSMEVSAMFRPHVVIEEGIIRSVEEPANRFHYDERDRLILFEGREPNMRWRDFAECVLEVVESCNVKMICFVGSVSSLVPHTRAPFFYSSVSEEALLPVIEELGLNPANYEGPASFVTYLNKVVGQRGVQMISAVAGIPAYVQGRNDRCIEVVTKKLVDVLDLRIDTDDLEARAIRFEDKLASVVRKRPDLAQHIQKLEQAYDDQDPGGQEEDLRSWFEGQGLNPDT